MDAWQQTTNSFQKTPANIMKESTPPTRPRIVINVVCGDADGPVPGPSSSSPLHCQTQQTMNGGHSCHPVLNGLLLPPNSNMIGTGASLPGTTTLSACATPLKAHPPAQSSATSPLPKKPPVPEIIPVEEDPDYYMNHKIKDAGTSGVLSEHGLISGPTHDIDYSYCFVESMFGCSTEQQTSHMMLQELLLEEEYIPGWQDVRSRLSAAGPHPLPERPLVSKKVRGC